MTRRRFLAAVLMVAALWLTSSCIPTTGSASADDAHRPARPRTSDAIPANPLIEDPHVGDLYAAELTYFSDGNFGGKPNEPMFGLMKVIRVDPCTVTFITESDAWPDRVDAIDDLRRHADEALWEPDERVRVPRSQLQALLASRRILEVRRP